MALWTLFHALFLCQFLELGVFFAGCRVDAVLIAVACMVGQEAPETVMALALLAAEFDLPTRVKDNIAVGRRAVLDELVAQYKLVHSPIVELGHHCLRQ